MSPRQSILIVDDMPRNLLALEATLSGLDVDLVRAGSGNQALAATLSNDFALAILDVQMPGMDGFEVARLVRSRERSRNTPIVFLTGAYDDMSSVFRGYQTGAVDYIVKPPDPDALRSKVSVFVALDRTNAMLRREVAERRVAEAQLRTSEANLRALTAHLQRIREEERVRISRDIHDELGQQLTGLKIELNGIAKRVPPELRPLAKRVGSVLALVDETIESVRKLARSLRPALTDQLELAAALELQIREFRRRTGLRCRLALPPAMPQLDNNRATALFRVFQEMLTNVARHAKATRVDAWLTIDKGSIVLCVQDNGRGFGTIATAGPGALGLLGMRERLRSFGGQVTIEGAVPKGTRVTATMPIDASGIATAPTADAVPPQA